MGGGGDHLNTIVERSDRSSLEFAKNIESSSRDRKIILVEFRIRIEKKFEFQI